MSKFLLNLLVQIFKASVYSKIQISFGNNSPQLSAHPAFRPSRGPFFFSNRLIFPPLPTGPRPPSQPRPPSRPNQPPSSSSSRTEAKHSAAAGRPRAASTGREKRPHIIPLHFPSLIGTIPPSSIPETSAFNPPLKLLQAGN
jgi:hypothetical protein